MRNAHPATHPVTPSSEGWPNGKAPVSKTGMTERSWGFESLTLLEAAGDATGTCGGLAERMIAPRC